MNKVVEPVATATLKEEHTPGPWKYVRDCDYWEIRPTQIGGKDNYEGNEADYRLAAAAPDLLAVLQRVVRIRDWSHDESHDACREYDNAADEARRVVLQATNGSGSND